MITMGVMEKADVNAVVEPGHCLYGGAEWIRIKSAGRSSISSDERIFLGSLVSEITFPHDGANESAAGTQSQS